jgi:hypothetical protein
VGWEYEARVKLLAEVASSSELVEPATVRNFRRLKLAR